jgi:hypothetical protein
MIGPEGTLEVVEPMPLPGVRAALKLGASAHVVEAVRRGGKRSDALARAALALLTKETTKLQRVVLCPYVICRIFDGATVKS